MTDNVTSAQVNYAAPWQAPPSAALASAEFTLPESLAPAFPASGDALAQLMVAMKAASEASLDITQLRINGTRADLKEQLEEFLEKIRDAAKQLHESKDDGGGWFGDFFDDVGDILGTIVGTLADATVDAVTLPYEVGKSVVENWGDTQAMLSALETNALDLVRNGSTAADVKGFTQGVVSFTGDLSEYLARLPADAGLAALKGENPFAALAKDAQNVWRSLKANILENPGFWAVTAAISKGVALAAAAVAGGPLGVAVVAGLMVALEADQKYGLLQKVVGEKAAPWVRMGIELGAAVCLGVCGATSTTTGAMKTLQVATSLVQAGGTVYSGVRTIQNAEQEAEELEQQASIQGTMNHMQQLQRLLERLLDSLQGDSKSVQKTEERAVSLIGVASATQAALIMPA
ncbi:MAG: hypothetical protein QM756_36940 [Polyangiaceae bacterium]